MQSLAVCIPTYKRPKLLLKALNSILTCDLKDTDIAMVDIVVVDNDRERTAEDTVNGFMGKLLGNFKVHYHNFPKKGLANVRNELLNRAITFDPDYIVFIDDDEYATESWLKELLKAISENNADMALGPVFSVFESPVPDYVSHWFKKGQSLNDMSIQSVASNNLIIRTEFLIKSKLKFDGRFNTTGAEDTYFGIQAKQEGAKIITAKNAILYETIFDERANIKWLIKRRYRGAITFTYILLLEKQYYKLMKKMVISLIYLLTGFIGLILLPFTIKWKYWGILKIAEGAGGFAGLFNIQYHEYK